MSPSLDEVPEVHATAERILDGALRAISRRGLHKLSMTDICDAAGISRGTLYRYFKSKEDVLEGIAQHVKNGFAAALRQGIRRNPAPEDRLRVVLEVIVHYSEAHPEADLVIQEEPAFALEFLRRHFPEFLKYTRDALEPFLDDARVVQDGTLTRTQLAEVFLRIGMSTYLIPSKQSGHTPRRVNDMWQALAGRPRSSRR